MFDFGLHDFQEPCWIRAGTWRIYFRDGYSDGYYDTLTNEWL